MSLRDLMGGRGGAGIPAAEWAALMEESPLLRFHGPAARERLRELAGRFLERKAVEGAGGLAVDARMARVIAAQACLPILELGLDWYDGWYSVVVYPDDFVARHEYVDEAGVVHEVERDLGGEAWGEGPIVLSWEGCLAGFRGEEWGSLVIHECAHKLDLANGVANGMPPLPSKMSRTRWTRVMSTAFETLARRIEADEEPLIDDYAAEDPGEFFAVVSEAFFGLPDDLVAGYPEVYRELAAFYRQDPLAGIP
jgi:MtfA peptidase